MKSQTPSTKSYGFWFQVSRQHSLELRCGKQVSGVRVDRTETSVIVMCDLKLLSATRRDFLFFFRQIDNQSVQGLQELSIQVGRLEML